MSQPDTEPDLTGSSSAPVTAPPRPFKVHGFGLTHAGKVRPTNEDHFAVVELARTLHVHQTTSPGRRTVQQPPGHVFVVADGMGGHRVGGWPP